jgi:hypothetical protein
VVRCRVAAVRGTGKVRWRALTDGAGVGGRNSARAVVGLAVGPATMGPAERTITFMIY